MLSTTHVVILALVAGIAGIQHRALGAPGLDRPIVLGPLTGLILGDFQTGLIVGAELELIWMGVQRIGGAVPPNITIGSILGVSLAALTGTGIESALAIAVPAALFGSGIETLIKTVTTFFIHQADRYAEKAQTAGIAMTLHVGNSLYFLQTAVPVFLVLAYGAEPAAGVFEAMPQPVIDALGVAGGLLPVLGFAILVNYIAEGDLMPYFYIGFLAAAFLDINVLTFALIGVAIAYLVEKPKLDATEPPSAGA